MKESGKVSMHTLILVYGMLKKLTMKKVSKHSCSVFKFYNLTKKQANNLLYLKQISIIIWRMLTGLSENKHSLSKICRIVIEAE